MTEQTDISDVTPVDHDGQLYAMQMQLRSQRAGDILRGMNQVRKWLQDNPEDGQVYEILLDVVEENHDVIRERVRDLFLEMIQKGSKGAEEALAHLPSTPEDLLADADDAYYAAEYGRAIQLYVQVLRRVPDHKRAIEYLAKAKTAQQDAGEFVLGLPREAVQYYRRARSYLAAKDFLLAIKSLSAAVESAQARNLPYPDAEELLKNAQDSLIADEYRQNANLAIQKDKWEDALDLLNKGLSLSLADVSIQKELDGLRDLLIAELEIRKVGQLKLFAPLTELQNALRVAQSVVGSENLLLKLVSSQIRKIKLARITTLVVIALGGVFILYRNELKENVILPLISVDSPQGSLISQTPTFEVDVVPTINVADEIAPLNHTETLTSTLAPTLTPTLTLIPVLGYGKLTEYTFPLAKPNGDVLGIQLKPKQYVTILDRREINGFVWYDCRWEIDGEYGDGWILEKFIQFAPPPTPTP